MTQLARYNIAFKGFAEGKHEFEYLIKKEFFEFFAGGIADDGNVEVKVILEKQSALMTLWFHVNGSVKIQCDRCLDVFDQPVESENRIFVKFGEESFDEGDDVVWVGKSDNLINVAKLIYDFIILSIPIKHVHPDKNLCNPEMIKKLGGINATEDQAKEPDSRWDELKKLLDNK